MEKIITYTSDEMETLKKYEDKLWTAYQCGYFRAIGPVGMSALDAIYSKYWESNKMRTGCGKCVLDCLRQIAKVYYEQKKMEESEARLGEQAAEDSVQVPVSDNAATEVLSGAMVENKPKKRGRPKKDGK